MAKHTFKQVMASGRWSHPLLMPFFAPPSYPLTYLLVNLTPLTANQASVMAGVCGLAAAGVAASGQVFLAGLLFCAFFTLDCVDGPLARLRNTKSAFGAMLDLRIDRLVIGSMIVCLVIAFTRESQATEARLTALFGVLFFYYDVFGMYRPDRDEAMARGAPPPPPTAGKARAGPGGAGMAGRLLRLYRKWAPTQSLCSVTFFCAGSLVEEHRAAIYAAACVGLVWAFLSRGAAIKFFAKAKRILVGRQVTQ